MSKRSKTKQKPTTATAPNDELAALRQEFERTAKGLKAEREDHVNTRREIAELLEILRPHTPEGARFADAARKLVAELGELHALITPYTPTGGGSVTATLRDLIYQREEATRLVATAVDPNYVTGLELELARLRSSDTQAADASGQLAKTKQRMHQTFDQVLALTSSTCQNCAEIRDAVNNARRTPKPQR